MIADLIVWKVVPPILGLCLLYGGALYICIRLLRPTNPARGPDAGRDAAEPLKQKIERKINENKKQQ